VVKLAERSRVFPFVFLAVLLIPISCAEASAPANVPVLDAVYQLRNYLIRRIGAYAKKVKPQFCSGAFSGIGQNNSSDMRRCAHSARSVHHVDERALSNSPEGAVRVSGVA